MTHLCEAAKRIILYINKTNALKPKSNKDFYFELLFILVVASQLKTSLQTPLQILTLKKMRIIHQSSPSLKTNNQ